ncbi:MAG: hypothetical protein NC489_21100 [Ruminococcus flavefaciens]|nr:hypothetical protein [Ruminococcus flavefaciens]
MSKETIIMKTVEFLQNILDDENVNMLKAAESLICSIYVNEKYSKIKTIMNFQISDGEFFFSVNINKDQDGNIILFNVKKEDL